MYGKQCNNICGHCFENDCLHINGTCLRGCEIGYVGEMCKTGMLIKHTPSTSTSLFT